MKKFAAIYTVICSWVGAYIIGKIAGEKIADMIMKMIIKE